MVYGLVTGTQLSLKDIQLASSGAAGGKDGNSNNTFTSFKHYNEEAWAMETIRKNMAVFDDVVVPTTFPQYTKRNLIVMTKLEGLKY